MRCWCARLDGEGVGGLLQKEEWTRLWEWSREDCLLLGTSQVRLGPDRIVWSDRNQLWSIRHDKGVERRMEEEENRGGLSDAAGFRLGEIVDERYLCLQAST